MGAVGAYERTLQRAHNLYEIQNGLREQKYIIEESLER